GQGLVKLNVRVGQFYSGQITKKWVSFKPALTFIVVADIFD
ncbi:hypothetical protein SAMN05216299_115102, partial [Nitrosospira sp. Nsp14]